MMRPAQTFEITMLKRLVPYASALALTVCFAAGCQDTPATGPDSSTTAAYQRDAYIGYTLTTEELNDFNDAPTLESILSGAAFDDAPLPLGGDDPNGGRGKGPRDSADGHGGRGPDGRDTVGGRGPGGHDSVGGRGPGGRDTTRKPPPPPRDTTHKPPRDTTRKPDTNDHRKPVNYGRIIGQLNLTPAQDSLIRRCFNEWRECTQDAAARYRNARQALKDSLIADLREIHAAVEAGTLTREEARALINRLLESYRTQGRQLEAAYRQAIGDCQQAFERCIRSILTEEQIAIWERLTRR